MATYGEANMAMVKESERDVVDQVNRLRKAVEQHRAIVENLEVRLAAVLTPERPAEVDTKTTSMAETNLGNDLIGIRTLVEGGTRVLHNLIDRLGV